MKTSKHATKRTLAAVAAACLLLGVGAAGLDDRPAYADENCCGKGGGKSFRRS